jgi:hypothetical protein
MQAAGFRILILSVTMAFGQEEVPPINKGDDGFISIDVSDGFAGWIVEGSTMREEGDSKQSVWHVQDGVVVCRGGGFGFLRYDRPLTDFVFRCECRMGPGCNSGIGIRGVKFTGPRETRPSFAGYEVQLLDDGGAKPTRTSSGSLYRYVAPTSVSIKPPGDWNAIEIECRGPKIRITINDVTVQDVDQSKIEAIAGKPLAGYLSLQNHGSPVEFRRLRLKELLPTKAEAASP